MIKEFNRTEKIILGIASFMFVVFSYLMYDDSLIFLLFNSDNLDSIGVVTKTESDVRQKISKQYIWFNTKAKNKIHFGDSIFTGDQSSASVTLNDGSVLEIEPNSLIVFNVNGNKLNLDLKFGEMSGNLVNSIEVKSNNKIENISNKIKLEVKNANVKIDDLSKAKSLYKNDKTAIVFNENTTKNLIHYKRNVPFFASWTTTREFSKFAIEMSGKSDFKKTVLRKSTTSKKISFNDYPLRGGFYLRIKGYDANDEISATSAIIPVVINSSAIPQITKPTLAQEIEVKFDEDQKPVGPDYAEIIWQTNGLKGPYEVQIATDEEFKKVVQQFYSETNVTKSKPLNTGNYFVKVRQSKQKVSLQNGEEMKIDFLWSEPVEFSVNRLGSSPLAAPELIQNNIAFKPPEQEAIPVEWKAVERAHQYIVELSKTKNFKTVQAFKSQRTTLPSQVIVPGRYFFRVTALTKLGKRGTPSEIGKIAIDVNKPILSPIPPKQVRGQTPESVPTATDVNVAWTVVPYADSYLIQVSDKQNFEKPIQFNARTPSSVVSIPQPGVYNVRVQPLTKTGVPITEFSDPQTVAYTFKVPLIRPQQKEPADQITLYFQRNEETPFWLTWNAVKDADSYTIEIAKDPDFKKIKISKQLTTTKYLFKEKLNNEDLYWRVRSESGEKVSDWAGPRKMLIRFGRQAGG